MGNITQLARVSAILKCPNCAQEGYKKLAAGSQLSDINPILICPDCHIKYPLFPYPHTDFKLPPTVGLQLNLNGEATGGKQYKLSLAEAQKGNGYDR